MDRRTFVSASGIGLGTLASVGFAQSKSQDKKSVPAKTQGGTANYASLADAAYHCAQTTDKCLNHCLETLSKGDTMLAECAKATRTLTTMAQTLGTLASMNSKHTQSMAKVCAEACKDCMDACKPHVTHHQICKECYESCEKCLAECKKVMG